MSNITEEKLKASENDSKTPQIQLSKLLSMREYQVLMKM